MKTIRKYPIIQADKHLLSIPYHQMKANELEIPIHVGTRCVSASGQPFIVLQVDDNSGMLLVRNENSGNEAQISTEGFEKALLDERTRNQAKEPESSQIPDSNEELVSRIEEELRKKQEGKEYKDV